MAFFTSDNSPRTPRKLRTLPLRTRVLTALDLDVEQLLHRFLDLRLGRMRRDAEHHLAVLGRHGRLFGDHRREDDVVVARILGGHFSRASSASSAARVSTSVFRRRMS